MALDCGLPLTDAGPLQAPTLETTADGTAERVIAAVTSQFKGIDANHDGIVTRAEFDRFVRALPARRRPLPAIPSITSAATGSTMPIRTEAGA
jgi:hypothetical protein